MTVHRLPPTAPSIFQPTWGRFFVAALLALLGFLLPQEVPLEWYPLNNPGTDINYLEISCAANVTGEVQIAYDLARHGHRPIDTIRWPNTSGPNPAAGGEGIVKGMSESAGACNSTLTLKQICSTYAG